MVYVDMCALTYHWNPLDFLNIENITITYGLVILNRPISVSQEFMVLLWEKASVRVTVDGGTNRWHKFSETHCNNKCVLPDMITGDLDSVTPDILAFYQSKGVEVVETPDQNETDFTKALQQIAIYCEKKQIKLDAIIVIVESSGRLDQIIGNINTLHKAESIVKNIPVFLMGRNSLAWLLNSGFHEIAIPKGIISSHRWCSLIPFSGPARVTTTGLKWNLDDRIMEFGKMVSTSNTFNGSPVVTVASDRCIVWSMGLNISDKDDDND